MGTMDTLGNLGGAPPYYLETTNIPYKIPYITREITQWTNSFL